MKPKISAKIGLNLWPQETCLVSELSHEFSQFDKFSFGKTVLIFPTQRLEVYFLSELSKKLGAFPKPRIFSFENFVEEFLEDGDLEESIVSDLACEMILGTLIKEKKYSSILLGDEHELKQFFCEAIESKIEDTCFDSMREIFREDIYYTEDHLDFMFKKTEELEDLFHSFQSLLQSKKLLLKDAYYRKAVEVLKEKWEKKENLPWDFIYFVGFTTLRSDFISLTDFILNYGDSSFWATKPPDLFSKENPIRSLVDSFSCLKRERKPSFFQNSDRTSIRKIKQAGTALSETQEAYKVAKSYCDQGLNPSKIGILVSCEATYANLVRLVFEDKDLKANIAVSLRLSQTLFGSWISSFMGFVFSNEEKNEFLAFLLNPISFSLLQSFTKEENFTREKLSSYFLQSKQEKGVKKILNSLDEIELTEPLTLFYEKLKPFIEAFSSRKNDTSLKSWAFLIDDLFSFFRIYDRAHLIDNGLSHLVSGCAHQFLDALTLSYSCYNPLISSVEIGEFFNKKILNLELRNIGYPLEGIQILRLIESRYIPFEVVIILGCSEGKFPKKLPKDYLLDDWLKKRVGLRGWEYVEALEDTTYHLLKERVNILELFYSKMEKGRDLVPSRFLEIERSLKKTKIEIIENDWNDFFSKTSFSLTQVLEEEFTLDSQSFFKALSAKSSSFLLNCPFRFMLHSLKVEPRFFHRNRQAMEEGKFFHKILEIFYKGCFEENLKLKRLPKVIKTSDLYQDLFQRIERITTILFSSKLSKPLVHHLLNFSWPHFILFFSSFYKEIESGKSELIFDRSYRELNFGGAFSEVSAPMLKYKNLALEEESVFLRGSIDSTDSFEKDFLLIDYKRKRIPTQREQDSFKDSQLLFYSLVYQKLFKSDPEHGLVGYWNIIEGTWHPRATGEEFSKDDKFKSLRLKKATLKENTIKFEHELVGSLLKYKKESSCFEKRPGKICDTCDYLTFCQPKR